MLIDQTVSCANDFAAPCTGGETFHECAGHSNCAGICVNGQVLYPPCAYRPRCTTSGCVCPSWAPVRGDGGCMTHAECAAWIEDELWIGVIRGWSSGSTKRWILKLKTYLRLRFHVSDNDWVATATASIESLGCFHSSNCNKRLKIWCFWALCHCAP